MVAHVQKLGEGYAIVLSEEALRELNVTEGAAVEIRPAVSRGKAVAGGAEYISTTEALDIFHRTKERYRHAYEELAK